MYTFVDGSKFKVLQILLKPAQGGVDGSLLTSTTLYEQDKSNRACNILNFALLGFL
jgi:hypothetical protein